MTTKQQHCKIRKRLYPKNSKAKLLIDLFSQNDSKGDAKYSREHYLKIKRELSLKKPH